MSVGSSFASNGSEFKYVLGVLVDIIHVATTDGTSLVVEHTFGVDTQLVNDMSLWTVNLNENFRIFIEQFLLAFGTLVDFVNFHGLEGLITGKIYGIVLLHSDADECNKLVYCSEDTHYKDNPERETILLAITIYILSKHIYPTNLKETIKGGQNDFKLLEILLIPFFFEVVIVNVSVIHNKYKVIHKG